MGENAPGPALAEPSDALLIARIRGGDPSAYGTLYERHYAAARSLAGHLITGDAADDAVQEAFAKILDVLRRGGGPRADFRPYLLTAVRRTVYDRYRGDRRLQPTAEMEDYDPGRPFEDTMVEGLERSMIVRAYRSLPERWRAVLWHTEIEGSRPADVAPMLGMTPNGVAALAYRAREGLRQAYLQMHLADPAAPLPGGVAAPPAEAACRYALERLGAHARGGLSKREARAVNAHLDECDRCAAIYGELTEFATAMREGLGPLVLGGASVAYLAVAGKSGLAGGGLIGWFRHLPKRQQQALGGGSAVAAGLAAVAMAMALTSGGEPLRPAPEPPPAAQPGAKPRPQPAPPPARPPAAPKPAPPGAPLPAPADPARPAAPPAESPSPSPPPDARVTAAIGTVGALLRDRPGIVVMTVRNEGAGRTEDLVADVDLPPGVDYDGAVTGRRSALFAPGRAPGDGWTCRPRGAAVRCTRAPVAPGGSTAAYLRVLVGSSAPIGTPPRLTLRGGGAALSARAEQGVAADGMPARFAVDGNVRTVETGNALLSCPERAPRCAAAMRRERGSRDNDFWPMAPVDRDDDPSTRSSSAARLPIRSGADVLWAGLYWSGGDTGAPVTARLRGPGAAAYTTVRAADVGRARLPDYPVYQAFADVTSLVKARGGGTWWGADVPSLRGPGRYAGWSLVVVVRDAGAPYRQAMVLDGVRAFGPHGAGTHTVPLNGLLTAARPARLGLVTWEGDADLPGDTVALSGRRLTPEGGDRDPGNVFDGSCPYSMGTKLTFGIDVDTFSAVLARRPVLTLTTRNDALLTGVITVTAPLRS
ncbi:sigma-70 family RNA polymerase sigma factor [Actinomadura flavalba]|uniref:sigma-70 family RNA polymerase sigma factor n=1 Tax=Actinomadura flavalba TaxID=1120938 RepID=UPI0003A2F24F|nr:sigma-70 family RNA polymerase sigma factor [Actinomadura flavalba]